nr:hypothetical protein CFP56_09222 [Quercus suber]
MRRASKILITPCYRRTVSSMSSSTSKPPLPKPRPFKSPTAEERLARHQVNEARESPTPAHVNWPWPFSSLSGPPSKTGQEIAHQPTFYNAEPKDPKRGLEAARTAIVTGKLDPRYRSARNRVLTIMVALPFVIVLSYELMQRRFYGKVKKVRGAGVDGEQQDSEYGHVPDKVLDEAGGKR